MSSPGYTVCVYPMQTIFLVTHILQFSLITQDFCLFLVYYIDLFLYTYISPRVRTSVPSYYL